MAKRFVFNNQQIQNSYGFRIRNSGIRLERFNANPIMLDDHRNSTKTVLGKWKELQIDGMKYSAESIFDTDDPDSAIVAGKVDREFIKACSMGIFFDYDAMEMMPDGVYELTSCELYEISICAVPSNAGCIALYTKDGELIPEEQVKLSLSALIKSDNKLPNENEMEKIALTAGALVNLGLKNADDVVAVSKAIEDMSLKLTNANAEIATLTAAKTKLEDDAKTVLETAAETLIAEAELAGKFSATTREDMKKMAIANFSLTSKIIADMPKKTNLAATVVDKGAAGAAGAAVDSSKVKTMDDFEKLSNEAKMSFKTDHPAEYKAIFA